jgi:prepilin-type N-terminal cleavage/methylation domain-containing protein/prepilin-type processing-associated H-X9-DG protein
MFCNSQRKGFTLVELLVVIAIIALLIAILLPAVQRGLRVTETTVCSSNVRQFATAVHTYAIENDDIVPTNDMSRGGRTFWPVLMAPYLGSTTTLETDDELRDKELVRELLLSMEPYRCPSLTLDDGVLHYTVNNGLKAPDDHPGAAFINSRRHQSPGYEVRTIGLFDLDFSPSRTAYNIEVAKGSAERDNFNFFDMHSWSHVPFNYEGEPNNGARTIKHNDDRHLGKTTVSFFDGHAEQLDLTSKDFPREMWMYFDYDKYD